MWQMMQRWWFSQGDFQALTTSDWHWEDLVSDTAFLSDDSQLLSKHGFYFFFPFLVSYAVISICISYPENFYCPIGRKKRGGLLTCNYAVIPEVFLAEAVSVRGLSHRTARQSSAKMKLLSGYRLGNIAQGKSGRLYTGQSKYYLNHTSPKEAPSHNIVAKGLCCGMQQRKREQ